MQLFERKSGGEIAWFIRYKSDGTSIEEFLSEKIHSQCSTFHHVETVEEKLARINDYKITSEKIVVSDEWKAFLS